MDHGYAELDFHMELLDSLIGPKLSKNREIRFDYEVGRDSRPATLKPGREFFHVQITTRNSNHNPIRLHWFYHSLPDRSGWFITSLSLRGLGFENFDFHNLLNIDSLEYLDLQGNSLTEFDGSNLVHNNLIHTLNLSSNKLIDFSIENFKNFHNLRFLNLYNNKLQKMDLNHSQNFQNLNRIVLSKNLIANLKLDPIKNLPYLLTLDLSHNKISSLDLCLENQKLNSLIINDNQISNLLFTGNAPELSLIQMSNNCIQELEFEELDKFSPNLEKLYVWGCEITDLKFKTIILSLEELNFNSNKIKKIDFESDLPNLKKLELGYNQLTTIVLTKLRAKSIEIINLSCNPLKNLKISFENFPKLKLLDLSGTMLENIDLSIFSKCKMKNNKGKIGQLQIMKLEINHLKVLLPINCKIRF